MSDERYEIKGKLGQGGVGAVYAAFDTQLNREVAIKRVLAEGGYENQEDATKNLLKEATALSSVQHPHIVTVYDAGVDSDGPYVVMELIHGKTLDEMVERGTLTWDDLREIALQSQEALIAAQDLNLLHRDLKPSNVMVCWLPSGKFQVKIVDFGLAKFSPKPSLQTIDHGDAVFGSIFFMAPEQFERTPLDLRTDMYAMGCLYYYALTGEYPFNGDTAAAVMASHLQHHVTPLHELRPDIPKWGADWVMWHIERSMDARPKDAREALERFLFLDKQSTQPVTMSAELATPEPSPSAPKFLFPGATPEPEPETLPTPEPPAVSPPVSMTPQPTSMEETAATVVSSDEVNPKTSPQPISPPQDITGKVSPHTQAQNLAREATTSQTSKAPDTPPTPTTATTPTLVTPSAAAPAQPASVAGQPVAPAPTPAVQPAQPAQTTPPAPPAAEEAAAPAAPEPPQKKGLNNGAKWAIIGMLIFIAVVAGVLGQKYMKERAKARMVNNVMLTAKEMNDSRTLSDGIELTQEEVEGVLDRATATAEDKKRPLLLKTLAYAKPKGSFDINNMIIEHVINAQCPENIRTEIFKSVMTRRQDIANVAPLLAYAKETEHDEAAAAAIEAARASAEDQDADEFIDEFLNLINNTDSPSIRGAAERAAAELIAQSDNKEDFADPIIGSYESALNNDAKFAMLRLTGAAGGTNAAETVIEALNSKDTSLQSAAIAALGQWADDSQFETFITFIEDTGNDGLRRQAFDAAYGFLREERKREPKALGKLWKLLADTAQSQREKLQIIAGMANQKHQWAMPILQELKKDKDNKVADKADRASSILKRRLSEKK
ncbi:serine/threonine protein kinase [Verrucomicrobiaceae bacterium R5-34]|nr:serine/threonine protein kinase [Verrucomicrobiaceae bacterium R5-34]